MSEPIYLDHQATTPVDDDVIDAMSHALRHVYGNPSSRHSIGHRAKTAVDRARESVASLINAQPRDVFFTSGATEANNLIIKGVASGRGQRCTLVVSATEHPSVLDPAQTLVEHGVVVRTVQPTETGQVLPEALSSALTDDTFLASVMLANNEIGVINPVAEYAAPVHAVGALLHTDATQAVGHIDVDVRQLGVDFLSFSAHKLYGPKGIGAVFAPRRARRHVEPLIHGGGHERGFRSGTLNVPAIIGFGVAAEIAKRELNGAEARVAALRDLLLDLLRQEVGELQLNGSLQNRLPGNLNIAFRGVDAESLVLNLKQVAAFSTGAACSSTKVEPSHVLLAVHGDEERALSSVRFGIGRANTEEEVRRVATAVSKQVNFLRGLSRRAAGAAT